MFIISFDLSLNSTGYSIFNLRGKLVDMGTIDTTSTSEIQDKLKMIGDAVKKIRKKYKVSKIIIERGFTRFNHVTQKLFRVFGVINYLFYDVEQIYMPSKQVRKIICGNGNIKKDDFFEFVKDEFKKMKFQNNDEADSFALGRAYFLQQKEEKNDSKKTRRSDG